MKNWKRVVIGVAAAALLVTGAAAVVVVPRLNQRVLDYLNVEPENSEAVAEAVDLLYPGAMALDITKEDNGATLHVTQVLRDRYSILVLAELTAPEGTQLYMGEPDPSGVSSMKGLGGTGGPTPYLMDEGGKEIDNLTTFSQWELLEDDDPLDNRVSLMFTLRPVEGETSDINQKMEKMWVPANDLAYFDRDQQRLVMVYPGDWSFEVALPQQDIGWTQQAEQVIGELDGSVLTMEHMYLSPMTLAFSIKREGGLDFSVALDEESEAAYGRWLSIGSNVQRITLTTKDGETIPLKLVGGSIIGMEGKTMPYRLSKITDPARFQGGTLTLEWDAHNSNEAGSVTIPLNNLTPVEPALSTK